MENTAYLFHGLFQRYPCLEGCKNDIYNAFTAMAQSLKNGGKILCCGNGGSAADCDHFVGELMKGFLKKRPLTAEERSCFTDTFVADNLQRGLPAISLCAHSALMTAFENDAVPSLVFAQQVYAYAKKDDALLCFSTSGNSENIVYAAQAAKAAGITSIGITGEKASRLSEICDICINLPETETFKIQELTLPVYHCIAAMLEDNFFEV
ncbi:MAG: SIS domain-containing protein [Ruminococcaceae bacterium]|nr:SIS domain-containing protein [Oscillospiraceae bacterium]